MPFLSFPRVCGKVREVKNDDCSAFGCANVPKKENEQQKCGWVPICCTEANSMKCSFARISFGLGVLFAKQTAVRSVAVHHLPFVLLSSPFSCHLCRKFRTFGNVPYLVWDLKYVNCNKHTTRCMHVARKLKQP